MTVAGYLVLNNVRAAYVEIHTGVLICTPRLRKNPPAPRPRPTLFESSNCDDDEEFAATSRLSSSSTGSTATTMSSSDIGDEMLAKEERDSALPHLTLRRMEKQRDATTTTYKKTIHNENHEYEDSDEDADEPVPEDEPPMTGGGRERVVQLSGHIVEVIDKEAEFDTPSYPFSFQVNTYKPAKRDADGNKIGQSELVDSLILSAMDEAAKALWVKRIRHWNRFGWRETEFVHADDNDFFYLQARMLSNEKRPSSYHAYPSQRSSIASSSLDERASTSQLVPSGRPSRRRFYRAPVGLNALVPSI